MKRISLFPAAAAALFALYTPATVIAQGTTTGAIGGMVLDPEGRPASDARVEVSNRATGFVLRSATRSDGRYLVPGLEVGGPYTVSVRRIGFEPVTRQNVFVSLGQVTPVDFNLATRAVELAGVQVLATAEFSSSRTGVETSVSDTMIRRIPTLNRDVTDLVKLSPHVAIQTSGGPSAAGGYNRFNNFTLDGANQNDRFGLGSSGGTPGGAMNGRIISLDAVKEFQILLTPADVRHGNFAGMLVNAVTKSGTNQFRGGAVYAFRDPDLAASEPFIRNAQLEVKQYGFHLGGPIIRDRLHFFIAPEWQTRTQPATGPFLAKSPPEPGQIDPAIIQRIATSMSPFFDVGGGDLVTNENPLTNLSGRLDWRVTPNHRLVFRQLINRAQQDAFGRNANSFNTLATTQNSGFRLSSNKFRSEDKNQSSALQLFSYFDNGASNEFLLGYNKIKDERFMLVRAPEISVQVPSLTGATNAAVTFGGEQFSPGNLLEQSILEISNNYTRPIGVHTITLGARYEKTGIFNNFCQQCFGSWKFTSLDALDARTPSTYAFAYSNGGPIAADFDVSQISVYAQDVWNVTGTLALTYGLRIDRPNFLDTPVENDRIANAFTARGMDPVHTSWKPKAHFLLSPRLGFNWDPSGRRANQVRGTIGLFTGSPPLIMIGNSYANTGLGLVRLACSGTDVPTFTTDVDALPTSCAGQPAPAPGQAGTAGVNITDPNFKYPQNFTTSLGFDRTLPYGLIFTLEGMYRKAVNGVLVRDMNIIGPRCAGDAPSNADGSCPGDAYATDADGRVLYPPTAQRTVIQTIGTPAVSFSEGIMFLTNQSKDYSYTISPQIRREFGQVLDLRLGYTYMRSKDLQSLTSDRAISNWRNGAQYAGLESDMPLTTSAFERRHRFSGSGTYTFPWRSTDFSFYYNGTTGFPITYVALGDLNNDGFNQNDPIYIPVDVTEARTMFAASGAITANDQADAFERFINSQRCLQEQRGQIMTRNSCRTPWSNRIDVSLRHTLPELRGQRLTAQLDIFNFANLLGRWIGERQWGQTETPILNRAFPQQTVLNLASGQTVQPGARPLFTMNANTFREGAFNRQQTAAGNFYQMQLTMRYSF